LWGEYPYKVGEARPNAWMGITPARDPRSRDTPPDVLCRRYPTAMVAHRAPR